MKPTHFAISVLLLLFLATQLHAQSTDVKQKKFKYGKIEIADFDTKLNGKDSAASAVALFDIGEGRFLFSASKGGFEYVLERHIRYKIINKTGYDYANLELQFFNVKGYGASLDYMDGATHNLENGKIVTSKINKESKFTERQDNNFTLRKFALPNIKEGSIIEFKYQISTDFIFTLLPWYFQRGIPTLYSEFQIKIPEVYKYKVVANGLVNLNPKREMIEEYINVPGGRFETESLHLKYFVENIPALKMENYIPTMDDYVSRVGFELNSIDFPEQPRRPLTSNWPMIIHGMMNESYFGGFINNRTHCKELLKTILKDNKDSAAVAQKIFEYVKNTLKWNNHTSLYVSASDTRDIFDRKSGNSADLNLSLLALMLEANLKASPILLSTRGNGAHPGFPMIAKFNNIIVDVDIKGRHVYFDATGKNHTSDLIAFENLNHEGLLINLQNRSGGWVSLEDPKSSKKNVNYFLKLREDRKLAGELIVSTTNYEALRRRNDHNFAVTDGGYLAGFKKDKPGLEVKSYKAENLTNPEEPLVETMNVEIEDHVEEAGDLLYFNPLLFNRTADNPFELEDRKFPVDFAHPREETYRITVELPKGYKIDKVPANEKIILPSEIAGFTFAFVQEESRITLISKITINKSVFSTAEYAGLRELFKNVVRKQSEQIVLKKI
jgi:hypothetical protein